MVWRNLILFIVLMTVFYSCKEAKTPGNPQSMEEVQKVKSIGDYAEVNGIRMYYEVHGEGKPLVLIHGGGSTISSNYSKIIPIFSKFRKVIAMELQAYGRTSDRGVESTFEQDADDVAVLLQNMGIKKADVLGFSNGATTALQFAIRHGEMLDQLVLCSPMAKRNGVPDWFWDFMAKSSLDQMPPALQEAFLSVNPDRHALQIMHDRDAKRMVNFKDIPDELIMGISSKTLIIIGENDIITPQHAEALQKQISKAELVILPRGHGDWIGEVSGSNPQNADQPLLAVPLIRQFLEN